MLLLLKLRLLGESRIAKVTFEMGLIFVGMPIVKTAFYANLTLIKTKDGGSIWIRYPSSSINQRWYLIIEIWSL